MNTTKATAIAIVLAMMNSCPARGAGHQFRATGNSDPNHRAAPYKQGEVVVTFDTMPARVSFDLPGHIKLITENGIPYTNGATETYIPSEGFHEGASYESWNDKDNKYSRMWIESRNDARIVVRHRCALIKGDKICHQDKRKVAPYGPGNWTDEWYIYKPRLGDLVGRVVHSASLQAGRFECSSDLVNRIMHMVVWTQRGNLHSVPTDCPQRDERAGWMGDIQSFAQTAIFHMDMAGFFSKWLRDVRDSQMPDGRYPNFAPMDFDRWRGGTPAWADAGTIVPWRMYQNYADTRLLAEHYNSARRWVDFVHARNPGLLWEKALGDKFNDWLNGDTLIQDGWPRKGGQVPPRVLATAFFAHSTEIVAKMAAVIGRAEDARKYGRLFEGIKAAFLKRYVQPDGRIEGNTQAGYALALRFNLLPEALRAKAAGHLLAELGRYGGHMSTGIQTSHRLMLELTRTGHNDEAYRLLTLRTFPSWGFMVEQGATTIWERWDGYVKGRGFQKPMMNSFNPWALGAVGEWVWRNVVGLNPDESRPGWKHFTVAPRPGGGLTWARGRYDSVRGTIVSDWRVEAGRFRLDVTVPANTTATVSLPARDAESVTVDDKPPVASGLVRSLGARDGRASFMVSSGRYRFVSLMDASTGRP